MSPAANYLCPWCLLHCSHKNASVRRSAAQFILQTVELVGGSRVLGYSREVVEAVLLAIVKLVRDNSPEARYSPPPPGMICAGSPCVTLSLGVLWLGTLRERR